MTTNKCNTILEAKSLDKSFGGVHAVNNVSFELYEGEILGLIGPNGSGKSTIVNMISGVYSIDGGELFYQGKVINKMSIADRSRIGIGRTFQTPKPFAGLSLFDSVYTVAMQRQSFKEAEKTSKRILELVGMADISSMRSEKLPLEKRKWLDMARILATEPKVMLLDEVLAGLNPNEMNDCVELIKNLNKTGITFLFIEHVMKAVVSLCERIVVLDEGKLLTTGLPNDVLNDPEVIKVYLGGQYSAKNG